MFVLSGIKIISFTHDNLSSADRQDQAKYQSFFELELYMVDSPALVGDESLLLNSPHGRTTTGSIAAIAQVSPTITNGTIIGSAIDNAVIGANTATTGKFTTMTATTMIASGYIDQSVGNALTAAGTTRADALQLAKQINNVTTAGAGTGVILPAASAAGIGAIVIIVNAGANAIQVYGSGSDTIDLAVAATGVTLTNAKRCMYIVVGGAIWISAQMGAASA